MFFYWKWNLVVLLRPVLNSGVPRIILLQLSSQSGPSGIHLHITSSITLMSLCMLFGTGFRSVAEALNSQSPCLSLLRAETVGMYLKVWLMSLLNFVFQAGFHVTQAGFKLSLNSLQIWKHGGFLSKCWDCWNKPPCQQCLRCVYIIALFLLLSLLLWV